MDYRVNVSDLKVGMYVTDLDRPWVETPFLFQGFIIQSEEDIAALKQHCQYIVIDPQQGAAADSYLDADADPARANIFVSGAAIPTPSVAYEDTVPVEEELEVAKKAHRQVTETISNVMDDVRAGKLLSVPGITECVQSMSQSIIRNPDALMLLTKLKQQDSYTYAHCVDACTLAIAFARQLGMPREDLWEIATGTLLFDIGKMKIPAEILEKKGSLTTEEFELIKTHVQHSTDMLKSHGGFSATTINVALHHHERHNGTGYPQGLTSNQMPVASRMAAIVDCYDAITSDRPYGKAISPYEAIKKLYEWRNVDFQEELVEQFIQCLGVYPTGTVVELSTGEIGIVLSQNRVRRLRPKIMLVLDSGKKAYAEYATLDLAMTPSDADGNTLDIKCSVEASDYGIDPKDFYL